MDILISDTHLANHKQFATTLTNGLNSRLKLQLNVIEHSLEEGAKLGCHRWIHLGDLFNDEVVDRSVYNSFKELIKRYKDDYESFIIISGNHDFTIPNEYFNTANVLNGYLDKVFVITNISELVFRTYTEWFIPYNNEKTEEDISAIEAQFKERDLKNTIIYMHQTIKGSVGQNGKVMEKGINPSVFKQAKAVFCGHTHSPKSFFNKINILGAPYHMDFGDSGERYFYAVDKGVIVHKIKTNNPKFITVKRKEDIKQDGNFYRLVTGEKNHEQISGVKIVHTIHKNEIKRAVSYKPEDLIKQHSNGNKEYETIGLKIFKEANK